MTGDAVIRRMAVEDVPAVFRLGARCWDVIDVPYNWWSLTEVATHLEEDADLCLVAELDGQVVGFVIGAASFEVLEDTGHLEWIAVDPNHRRRHLASRLLEAELEAYRALGRKAVATDIGSKNVASQELVRRHGFAEGVSITFFMRRLEP
jgi:ribosomal protein S18 acetylase RimI-like enzyme